MTQRSPEIFNVQEFERVISATLSRVNPEGVSNGTNDVRIFRFLSEFPGMGLYLGEQYLAFVRAKLAEAEGKLNARDQVAAMQMYPRAPREYPPWIPVAVPADEFHDVCEHARSSLFSFQLEDGKLLAAQTSGKPLTEIFYNALQHHLPGCPPYASGACHVSLVGSPLVHKLTQDAVKEFVDSYYAQHGFFEFKLDVTGIKMTFSEDWPRFSRCIVMEVSSERINVFLAAFNQHFGTNVKPSPHITFAVQPRDLFPMSAH